MNIFENYIGVTKRSYIQYWSYIPTSKTIDSLHLEPSRGQYSLGRFK